MSWEKIEDHLFNKYYVEGEDKELERLCEKHDKRNREQVIDSIKLEEQTFVVFTKYEHDGCNRIYEYHFKDKKEFLNFIHGENAINKYGETVIQSYYEHVEYAYIKGSIDVMALYQQSYNENDFENEDDEV